MPFNNFTVGKDVSIDILTPDQGIVSFNLLCTFGSRQLTHQVKIIGLDGYIRWLELPGGWEGSIEFERQDYALDDYFAFTEDAYYQGVNIQSATITETTSEIDGSVTQYRYVGCMFRLEDAGNKSGENSVKQRLAFVASRRIKVQ